MGLMGALQIIFDIFAGCGIFMLLMKLARAPKDDPRLSRGLQILQSKIAILEDLSDRTEHQVRGLMSLLDQKNIEVQTRIDKAGEQVRNVENSIRSSMDVAKIFQDKIPHQEIIERQNTLKYLVAARLANQGVSADEIAQKVDLPMGEIEFISKVNREQLSFAVEELPAWAQAELAQLDLNEQNTFVSKDQPYQREHAQQQPPIQEFLSYGNESHYVSNFDGEVNYEISQEIAPLAAYANEPQFTAYDKFRSPNIPEQNLTYETRETPTQHRELTANDNKNLSTLKRTQSIILNLDKQFSMSGFEVDEDEPGSVTESIATENLSLPEVTAVDASPGPQTISARESIVEPKARVNSYAVRPQVNRVTQSLGTYDPASIRKVIFPTVQSTKSNQRF